MRGMMVLEVICCEIREINAGEADKIGARVVAGEQARLSGRLILPPACYTGAQAQTVGYRCRWADCQRLSALVAAAGARRPPAHIRRLLYIPAP